MKVIFLDFKIYVWYNSKTTPKKEGDFVRESSVILYRCAFVINREAVIWDNRSYQKRQHAYNRLEKLKDEYPYDLKYGKGQWEVMYTSGWKRDNNKKTIGISTVKWIEEEVYDEEEEFWL